MPTERIGRIRRRADITMHRDGTIDLSSRVVQTLCISPGDIIEVLRDGEEYYLRVAIRNADNRFHGRCYKSARKGQALRCNNKSITIRFVQDSLKHSYMCGETREMPTGKTMIIIREPLRKI